MMKLYCISILFILATVLTGCGSSPSIAAEPTGPLSPAPTKTPFSTLIPAQPTQGDKPQMNPILATPSTSGQESLIEIAKQDLSQRLSIPAGNISVVEAREVTWSDGSLGCPQSGMMFAQVLTPGYLVKLAYDGREFEYHAGKDKALSYCKNPIPPVEGAPVDT